MFIKDYQLFSVSLHFNGHFPRWTCVSWYLNVSILDFVGAKEDWMWWLHLMNIVKALT